MGQRTLSAAATRPIVDLVGPCLAGRREYAALLRLGVKPAEVLDPNSHAAVPPAVLLDAQHAMGASLIWVFVTMAVVAAVGILVTLRMPRRKCDHEIRPGESLEGLA